jgi:hypothetical protein
VREENVYQERAITQLTRKTVHHGAMQRYFVNMHAIHNAALIRKTLPQHLSQPRPYCSDRVAKHMELANQVSIANNKRRDATAAKARETRARNKQARLGVIDKEQGISVETTDD